MRRSLLVLAFLFLFDAADGATQDTNPCHQLGMSKCAPDPHSNPHPVSRGPTPEEIRRQRKEQEAREKKIEDEKKWCKSALDLGNFVAAYTQCSKALQLAPNDMQLRAYTEQARIAVANQQSATGFASVTDGFERTIEAQKNQAQARRLQNINAVRGFDETIGNANAVRGFDDLIRDFGAATNDTNGLRLPSADNPEATISHAEYRFAKDKLLELHSLEAKLVAKQAELDNWRGDMLSEKREFDRLHAEAAHGELGEVISVIPSSAILDHLLKQGMITAESAEKLKVLFERLKDAGKATVDAVDAKDGKESIKVQIEANQNVLKELIRISNDLPLDSPERLWDLRMVKTLQMFGATAKVMLGTFPDKKAQWWERAEPPADLAADLAGIAYPPFGAALAISSVIGRESRKLIVSKAQDSLGGAIAANWNAKNYLSQKLERVQGTIIEEQRTVNLYCLQHICTEK